MLLSSSDTLQIVTTNNTSGSLDWKIRYEDYNSTTGIVALGSAEGNINTNATTTVLAAPSAGNYRKVSEISIFNNNAGTVTAKIQSYNGSSDYNIAQSDGIQQFYSFQFNSTNGWKLQTDTGAAVSSSGTTGTVTSVGLTVPSDETVTGSPVTGSGTLAITRNSQSQNLFLASPSGSSGVPSYRAIVAADVPATSLSSGVTGTLGITNGGTGQTTAGPAFNALSPITSVGDLIIGTGTNTAGRLAVGSANYVLTSNGSTATWQSPGSVATLISTSANATYYPIFAGGSGSQQLNIGTGLSYNPSTNALTTTTFVGAFSGSGAALTSIPNAALVNSSIIVTGGTGLGVSGSPLSLGGTLTLSNTGVTSAIAGTNISVSSGTGAVTISVTGTVPTATTATNLAGGSTNQIPYQTGSGATSFTSTPTLTGTNFSGIPNSALTGSGQITVTGGTGLGVSGSPVALGGTVTLSNTGVTSAIGTTNQVNVSGATGAVTFSLPQSIATTSNVTFANATANAFIPASSTVPTNGVYLPSANDVGIATNSTLALNIDSSQRVTLPVQPAFMATRATGAQGSGTTLIFNNIIQQQGGTNYSSSTGIFTAPVAGWYMFTAGVVTNITTGTFNFYFAVTGGAIAPSMQLTVSAAAVIGTWSAILYLAASSTVSAISSTTLGSLTLNASAGSFFSGYLLG